MDISLFCRNNLVNLPYPLGRLASKIPFTHRPGIGKLYKKRLDQLKQYISFNNTEKESFIYQRIKNITDYAYHNIPFYKDYYKKNNFSPSQIKTFADIKQIPIITKDILLEYPLNHRSNENVNKFLRNTGGSSGKPLNFYVQPTQMANEWAHLHYIWKNQMNFKQSDLKVLFDGRSNVKNHVSYDFVRHSLRLDIYSNYENIESELLKKYQNVKVKYLHGYPSAIYEFAKYCNENNELKQKIFDDIKGVILNSEFPHKLYRNLIEDVFKTQTYSFYGHTEACIIAWENNKKYRFEPLQSYGHVEAICDSREHYLIGTSYYNYASPMIRYNTEDLIDDPGYDCDILTSFNIREGRTGEYIFDINNKKIPLTGLIFGRHHKLFDQCQHIQITQDIPGHATILFSSSHELDCDAEYLFDSSNVDVKFKFRRLENPIKTVSGKIGLKVDFKDA